MKTKSWSQIAREEAERFFQNYISSDTIEEKAEYKQYIFEKLFNPMREGEFIGYWRNPLIQRRIVKRWKRKIKNT